MRRPRPCLRDGLVESFVQFAVGHGAGRHAAGPEHAIGRIGLEGPPADEVLVEVEQRHRIVGPRRAGRDSASTLSAVSVGTCACPSTSLRASGARQRRQQALGTLGIVGTLLLTARRASAGAACRACIRSSRGSSRPSSVRTNTLPCRDSGSAGCRRSCRTPPGTSSRLPFGNLQRLGQDVALLPVEPIARHVEQQLLAAVRIHAPCTRATFPRTCMCG